MEIFWSEVGIFHEPTNECGSPLSISQPFARLRRRFFKEYQKKKKGIGLDARASEKVDQRDE